MQILSLDQVKSQCPAIFAPNAAPTMSDRYGFVSTADILRECADMGWYPTSAQSKRVRNPARLPYSAHTVRLARLDSPNVGEGRPEIIIRNGHDGSSAIRFNVGYFRDVCANGIEVGNSLTAFKIYHRHDASKLVGEAITHVAARLPDMLARVDAMRSLVISRGTALAFADQAVQYRWPGAASDEITQRAIAALDPLRQEDVENTLWNVFNRVQEFLLRGRRHVARRITSPTSAHTINTKLFDLAERFLTA